MRCVSKSVHPRPEQLVTRVAPADTLKIAVQPEGLASAGMPHSKPRKGRRCAGVEVIRAEGMEFLADLTAA